MQTQHRFPGTVIRHSLSVTAHFLLAIMIVVCAGCDSEPQEVFELATENMPELGEARTVEPGVQRYTVQLPRKVRKTNLWVYLPANPPAGKLPCVFIAPAGTPLIHGMRLSSGDEPEHLPYVRAGFAVVAYQLEGSVLDPPTDDQLIRGIKQFKQADAGIANARMAIDYALAKVPGIDPDRLYVAGHSSAGTVALLVAAQDMRIRGCAAYAPGTDVPKHLGDDFISEVSVHVSGFRQFVERASPHARVHDVGCPVFVFVAHDDDVINPREVAAYAKSLKPHSPSVEYVEVERGGHYDAMINEGVPQAIAWFKALPSK